MRLTLRTLLAYLDDVLDPADKEELGQKIESSEFAEDLVHRTRDTVRRLRLSAPQVIGTGMGLDPNTVAEYLDNVMPPEQVGDFERICLESDVHLAEATACHHVLTMVLGEPADVDPLARRRMYTIATEAGDRKQLRAEPAHATPTTSEIVAAPGRPVAALAAVAQQPRTVEIPEYLRTGAWWRSNNAVIALASVVLIGTAIVLVSGLGGWFSGTPALEPLKVDSPATTTDTASPNTVAAADQIAPDDRDQSASVAPAETPSTTSIPAPPQPLTPGISPPVAVAASEPDRYATPGPTDNSTPQQPAAADVAASSTPPTTTGAATPLPPTPGPTAPPADSTTASIPPAPAGGQSQPAPIPPAPTEPAASVPSATPPTNALATSSPTTTDAAAIPAPGAPAAVEVTTAPGTGPEAADSPPELGTYMGAKTVLLRYDDKAGTWFRVEPRAAVIAGERLLALPEFRPKITLVSGLHLDLSGGTQIIMGAGNGPSAARTAGAPTLELVYGRIVLINPTNADTHVKLNFGPMGGEARLARNATLAVEVERKHVSGQDPRQSPAPIETRLFAPDGGVVWQDAAGTKNIEKPSRWTASVAGATEVADDPSPPEWIDHEPIVQMSEQRFGAPLVESTLVSNVPAETQLLELFQGSGRKEVKSLVARSSIHVGLFEPFIDALRDSEQKANWKTHIETLRVAMALSPESAGKVKQALEDQRGKPAANDLYEMLCGYNSDQVGHTPDQMKTGALAKLINWLEEDSLDYRVLAVHDLKELTGKALMGNPAASLAERKISIRVWRARLESGQLKLVSQEKAE